MIFDAPVARTSILLSRAFLPEDPLNRLKFHENQNFYRPGLHPHNGHSYVPGGPTVRLLSRFDAERHRLKLCAAVGGGRERVRESERE